MRMKLTIKLQGERYKTTTTFIVSTSIVYLSTMNE